MLIVELFDDFIIIHAEELSESAIDTIENCIFEGKKCSTAYGSAWIQVHDVDYADLLRLNEHYHFVVI